MVNNSTNIDKANNHSHLTSQNTKNKGTMTDDVENPGPSFGQAQKSGRVKSLLK